MRRGPISRLAPAARLLCLLILVSGLFSEKWPSVLALIVLALFASFAEGLRPRALLPELLPLSLLAALMLGLETLSPEGGLHFAAADFPTALLDVLRLLAAFALARLFYQSTPASELREAAESAGRLLPGSLGLDAALALSLILGFIPSILLEWRQSLEAGRARGLHRKSGPGSALAFVAAFIGRILGGALVLPDVLVARGWTGQRRQGRAWGPWSLLAALLSTLVTALGIGGLI
ncbi:MAG TPA: hypothetical protein VMV44_06320 [Rectinemataceae bacterium]|nr:hypothetical protein [Rectinemataceae bacterium]